MKRNGANILDEDYDCECEIQPNWLSDGHFLVSYDVSKTIQQDKDAETILSLYKQMKLTTQIQKTPLEKNLKADLLYTNNLLINQIGATIQQNNYNYPKTYQNLTNSANSNTILWNIQNRAIHLGYDPFGNQEDNHENLV